VQTQYMRPPPCDEFADGDGVAADDEAPPAAADLADKTDEGQNKIKSRSAGTEEVSVRFASFRVKWRLFMKRPPSRWKVHISTQVRPAWVARHLSRLK
jgi:hypothetical protein